MNTITINNVTYQAVEFDFNFVCDLADLGVNIESDDVNTLQLVRAYVAKCANVSLIDAGKLITEHMRNGGKLDGIIEVIFDEVKRSGFFPEEQERAEEDAPKTPT